MEYTWSCYSRNPREHVADTGPFRQPLCGTRLSPGWQRIADAPSGLAPLCNLCQTIAKRMEDE